MSANSSASPSNKLPKKEAEIFKSIVTSYEQKQYTKGLKSAVTILKKFTNHGETLAMKGLLLNCMGRKDEAYDFVKIGLKNDLKSHICWHVYGLLYRSDTNYKEAIKCYLNALRIDPGNQNILRDLSWLQVQMRDIPGFIISRRKILEAKSTIRLSWVSFAVANYIGEYYSVAYEVISKYYENVTISSEKGEKYEESELILFQNQCLEKQRKYTEAMIHLESKSSFIVDKYFMKIKIAEYQLRVGNFEEAKELWLSLVFYQIDNYRLHTGLQIAYLELSDQFLLDELFQLKCLELPSTTLTLTSIQINTLKELYTSDTFQQPRFKKSKPLLTKIQLTFLQGSVDEVERQLFYSLLEEHMQYCLSEGIPALYHDVCSLIRQPKAIAITSSSSSSLSSGQSSLAKNSNSSSSINNNGNENGHNDDDDGDDDDRNSIKNSSSSSSSNSSTLRYLMVLVTDSFDFRTHPLVIYLRTVLEQYIHNLIKYGTFHDPSTLPTTAATTITITTTTTTTPTATTTSTAETATPADDKTISINQPNALLWTKFLYCHLLEKCNQLDEALTIINECIQHTPTALDMYLKKGKILKKLFLITEAADTVELGRSLDLQDRYLNNKATKYLLRANSICRAMDTIALFVRYDPTNDTKNDPQKTLTDLQCNWYELELAEAYGRMKQWNGALKKYYDVYKHFNDYIEDMFEFHNYSIRKTTLRMYLEVLTMQDRLFTHKFYQRAARGAIQIYLHLTDMPEDIDGLGHLSAPERKKERLRIKKKKAAAAAAAGSDGNLGSNNSNTVELGVSSLSSSSSSLAGGTVTALSSTTITTSTLSTTSILNDETAGEKYLTKPNLLQECLDVWCQSMIPYTGCSSGTGRLEADTLVLMAEVYFRKLKYLPMLRCVVCGLKVTSDHPGLNLMLMKLYRRVHHLDTFSGVNIKSLMKETTLSVIKEELDVIISNYRNINNKNNTMNHSSNKDGSNGNCTNIPSSPPPLSPAETIHAFITAYLSSSTTPVSLPHLLSQARILILTATSKTIASAKIAAAELMLTAMKSGESFWKNTRGVNYHTILETHKFFAQEIKSDMHTELFKSLCLLRFPKSVIFLHAAITSAPPVSGGEGGDSTKDDGDDVHVKTADKGCC